MLEKIIKKLTVPILVGALTISPCLAQQKLKTNTGLNITYSLARNLGYNDGLGLGMDFFIKYKKLGFEFEGSFSTNKKFGAKEGFTANGSGDLLYFIRKNFYVSGGINYGGYVSRFEDGSAWIKHARQVRIGMGYRTKDNQFFKVIYFLQEHQTLNRCSGLQITSALNLIKNIQWLDKLEITRYNQGGKRKAGGSINTGIRLSF